MKKKQAPAPAMRKKAAPKPRAAPAPGPRASVAPYLAAATEAHQDYRDHVNDHPMQAVDALHRAYDALSAAEGIDPQGTDPAWKNYPHVAQTHELLVFYRRQLEGK